MRNIKQMIADLFEEVKHPQKNILLLASTMEPVITRLIDKLEQAYYLRTGTIVRHVGAGSGQAMALAMMGRVDLVLTHAPEMEDAFIQEGSGTARYSVMRNDFILVGTKNNPAGLDVFGERIEGALPKITANQSPFISRGDSSGTHFRELRLWEWLGLDPCGKSWYDEAHKFSGSEEVMRRTAEVGGYTLVDRASYLIGNWCRYLRIYVQGDAFLTNVFVAIPVSREKVQVNQCAAQQFAEWLTDKEAAFIIANYGKDRYGAPLFSLPNL